MRLRAGLWRDKPIADAVRDAASSHTSGKQLIVTAHITGADREIRDAWNRGGIQRRMLDSSLLLTQQDVLDSFQAGSLTAQCFRHCVFYAFSWIALMQLKHLHKLARASALALAAP